MTANKAELRRMLFLRIAVLILASVALGFLALRSSPYLAEIPWMPCWLGEWADRHGVLRNVPAFAGLYFVGVLCAGWLYRLRVLAGVCILAAALEIAQIWAPRRIFEWKDIFISWAGALLAFITVEVWRILLVRIRR